MKKQYRKPAMANLASIGFFMVVQIVIAIPNVTLGQQDLTDWTQWRGPQRDGIVESEVLSSATSLKGVQKKWHVDLGPSYSGPLVVGDKIFVTETKDKKSEVVRALNRANGEQLWEAEWEGAMRVPIFARANGDWIRATPVYDEGRLYVPGMTDLLVCLDVSDGSEIWKIDFKGERGKNPSFGAVCSPLIHGDYLYIEAGNGLQKVDKVTGDVQWTALEGGKNMMSDGTFSSPLVATVAGKEQLLVQTRSTLAGVDLDSGDVLWSQEVPAYRGMNILTPTVYKDFVFTSSYNNGSYMYQVNSAEEGGLNSAEAWQGPERGYMSSPIRIDNYAYLHLQNTRFSCIDLDTGETMWKSEQFGKYWSMISSGDRILALDERGELLLVRANPEEFDLLDRKEVSDESTWAHVALSGNQIFVRELNGLTVYDWN